VAVLSFGTSITNLSRLIKAEFAVYILRLIEIKFNDLY